MKNLIIVLIFVLFTSSAMLAGEPIKTKNLSYNQIEKSLLMGLRSDNLGLQISCSYMLGEIKSKNSVPELTAIINNVDNDKARLTAILALLKIVSSEGIVKLNQNEPNDEITKICDRLIECHSCLVGIFDPQEKKEEVTVKNEEVSVVSD